MGPGPNVRGSGVQTLGGQWGATAFEVQGFMDHCIQGTCLHQAVAWISGSAPVASSRCLDMTRSSQLPRFFLFPLCQGSRHIFPPSFCQTQVSADRSAESAQCWRIQSRDAHTELRAGSQVEKKLQTRSGVGKRSGNTCCALGASCGLFTLRDARSFSELTSKIPPLSSMLNFDVDVKNMTARHQCENHVTHAKVFCWGRE